MDAAHPAKPKRSSSVHNVGHRNTLRHNLKSKIPNMAVLEPHSLDPKKNPSVGNPPPPISRKFWESSFTLSSAGGTVQKPGSDVILNVPPNAVDKDAKIDVYTAVCTDMDRVRRILNLPGDECVSSPLAEYWAGHEFRFKKPVSIKLPTFLPPNPDLQLVIINTDHFCGYVCTYCNLQQGPPVLEAIKELSVG
nr:hypothetical protein BaRGS_017853 [Batillaria attramentaria]